MVSETDAGASPYDCTTHRDGYRCAPPILRAVCGDGLTAAPQVRNPDAPKEKILLWDQRDSTRPVLFEKIFPFALPPNHIHISHHPVPLEGRFAIVTDVRTGCGGRGGGARRAPLIRLRKNFGGTVPTPPSGFCGRRSRTAKSCGPDASTPASSRWRQLRWRR